MKKKNFLPAWLYIWLTALYCELMIYIWNAESSTMGRFLTVLFFAIGEGALLAFVVSLLKPKAAKRSEERRVGKECRSRWSPYH